MASAEWLKGHRFTVRKYERKIADMRADALEKRRIQRTVQAEKNTTTAKQLHRSATLIEELLVLFALAHLPDHPQTRAKLSGAKLNARKMFQQLRRADFPVDEAVERLSRRIPAIHDNANVAALLRQVLGIARFPRPNG
jgi:hypothetical protein